MKASEKQSVCKKLVTALKKRYKTPQPRGERSVLDILLFAICLENAGYDQAEASFDWLLENFHDYNEMRVSSLSELVPAFDEVDDAEYRALRVKTVLQDLFEKYYSFDYEVLRKKTLEAATKQLERLRHLSEFVRNYTLQEALGAHLVPLDGRMRNAVVWLGLIEPDATPEDASETLKSAIRKADAPVFCHLLRQLATDPAVVKKFEKAHDKPPQDGFDGFDAVARLDELFSQSSKRTSGKRSASGAKRKTAGKKAAKSSTAKKKSAAKKKKPTKRRSAAKN